MITHFLSLHLSPGFSAHLLRIQRKWKKAIQHSSQQYPRSLFREAQCHAPMASELLENCPFSRWPHTVWWVHFSPGRDHITDVDRKSWINDLWIPNLKSFHNLRHFSEGHYFLLYGLCPPTSLPPCRTYSFSLPGLNCASLPGDTDLTMTTDALSCVLRGPHNSLQGPIGWDWSSTKTRSAPWALLAAGSKPLARN